MSLLSFRNHHQRLWVEMRAAEKDLDDEKKGLDVEVDEHIGVTTQDEPGANQVRYRKSVPLNKPDIADYFDYKAWPKLSKAQLMFDACVAILLAGANIPPEVVNSPVWHWFCSIYIPRAQMKTADTFRK